MSKILKPIFLLVVLALSIPFLSFVAEAETKPAKGRMHYEASGEIIWEVPTPNKVIALTFDDGPDPNETEKILDLLLQYQAKATFFVVGRNAEKYPDLIKREIAEGHEIANHTYNHKMFYNGKLSGSKLSEELSKTEEVIRQIGGVKTILFRPPGGYYNDTLVSTAKLAGYKIILWSWHQDTVDWRKPGVDKIVRKVLDNARGGDIVLMHDRVTGKSQTVEALERILPELLNRGFHFVTVSELLKIKGSNPVNENR